MDAFRSLFLIFLQLFAVQYNDGASPKSCPKMMMNDIPATHLFHKKEKPIIIAHRGQPKLFQENTKEGILSTLSINSDGFELDIYKTKDDKLVVFHDDNTKRMTNVSKIVYSSTYAELLELNLTTKIVTGGVTYQYDKVRKIPLLEDILTETSKHDVIHYLEMKPSDPFRPHEAELANKTGILVAEMVEKMNLFDKAIIVSFDFRKVAAVKNANPRITVGTLFTQKYSTKTKSQYQKANVFEELNQCLQDAPSDPFELFQFILNYGLLFKASGSSSLDTDILLYNNPKYSNDTLKEIRQNYGNNVSTGFYTIYSMSKTKEENMKDEKKLKQLNAQGGGQRMITDDVPRLRKFLGRDSGTSSGNNLNGKFPIMRLVVLLICLFLL